jgi:hypothetical protein
MTKNTDLTERVFVRLSLEDRNTILMLSTCRKGRDRSLSSVCREYIRQGIEREVKELKKQSLIEKKDSEQKESSKEASEENTNDKIENRKEPSIMGRIKNAIISGNKSKDNWN